MSLLRTYGVRLVWILGISASVLALLFFFGDRSVVPLACAAAALISVPIILLAPAIYGPRGYGARAMGERWCFPLWATKAVPGLIIAGCGMVMLGHFKANPNVAEFGVLIVIFGIEALVTKREFVMSGNICRAI